MIALRAHRLLLAALLMTLLIWLPRGLALDVFVTADEHAWLARSGNFYRALSLGDLASTFQRHHPGVTTTWAGLAGFVSVYPDYAKKAPTYFGYLTEEIEPFLRSQGYDPVDILAAGRTFVVLAVTASLLTAFLLASRLVGLWPALFGFTLLALAPFHIAHSRFLHLDGLVSSFMFLSAIAFLLYLRERRLSVLIISGVAAGLAWLTRSPSLYLALYSGIIALLAWSLNRKRAAEVPSFWRTIGTVTIWAIIGALTFVLLWPAMWVDPIGSLRSVLGAAGDYASEGHLKPLFFNGKVIAGDPGFSFYPVTWLWRTTPVTMVGLLLAFVAFIAHGRPFNNGINRFTVTALLAYALGFLLLMSLGAKKFDRYLLPVYPVMTLVAGMGYAAAGYWLIDRLRSSFACWVMPILLAVIVVAQAAMTLPAFPYYLSYYNPIMGGSARAPEVMMIGWGESGDQVADYLNTLPAAAESIVASGYTNGPFSYFYRGATVPLYFRHAADYAVVYAQDWQRQLPSRRAIAYYADHRPLHVVNINGLEYATIYDLSAMPDPDYVTDWNDAIRLVSYQLPAAVFAPGETVHAILYFVNLAPIKNNLNVIVRMVGEDGREFARAEGWPWGSATSDWQLDEVWPDGHKLAIPEDATPGWARIEVGFYDPASQTLLDAVQVNSGETIGDFKTLDYIQIGDEAELERPMKPPAVLGNVFRLNGVEWRTGEEKAQKSNRIELRAGDALIAELYWESLQRTDVDYTVFVHIVAQDGSVVVQADGQPLDGFMPTSTWLPGQSVHDSVRIDLPQDMEAGLYTVHIGMYDLATMNRLPVALDGASAGDSIVGATLTVLETP